MRPVITRASLLTSSLLLLTLVGAFSASSDVSRVQRDETSNSRRRSSIRSTPRALSYRSPGRTHKLTIARGDREIETRLLSSPSARRVKEFGSYTLIEVDDNALASLDAAQLERAQLRDDMNLLLLKRGQIDTTGPAPQISEGLRQPESPDHSLNLVQLAGPATPDAVQALKSTGARLIAYVPNNSYLVWTTPAQMDRVRDLGSRSEIVQWTGPFHPAYKLDPRIKPDSVGQIPVAIEILVTSRASETVAQIVGRSRKVLMPQFRAAERIQIRVLIESYLLVELARLPDIVSIEPWSRVKLHDERANQIVANAISEETINSISISRPATPGFFAFLSSNGFNSTFDFAVDIGDSGFDRGTTLSGLSHPDFDDGAGSTRLSYMHDFSSDFVFHADNPSINAAHDVLGHGTLNASIVGGFNNSAGSGFRDSLGFQYGMGVAPFVRIGVTKLFDDQGNFGQGFSYNDFLSSAHRGGARITTNSWGVCGLDTGFCNLYNADCSVFDGFVRDADVGTPGNQEMVVIFSSGNEGTEIAGGVNMPGTAKNVITVGATESFRAVDSSGNPLIDGCGVGPTLADNAKDMADFSSFGPVQDGRVKPDLVAPGTHITGAATQDPAFATRNEDDLGVCDRYFPASQTLYTWSTGTSHAAPIVAGGAALAFQWLRTRLGADPSPALVKSLMLNATSYVTGRNGNDNLPGVRQGWGLLNLGRMFESTGRIIYDQAPSRTFTRSGDTPFETTGTVVDPSKEFRVMLTWTDAPGVAFSNASYVNQLNLEVVVGGVVYSGNHFSGQYSTPGGPNDFLNNAQGVRLPAGTTGPFVVRVKPTIISGDGVPGNGIDLDQDFALVITNAREEPVPVLVVGESNGISVGASVTHTGGVVDASLLPNENALISVTVSNQSSLASANIIGATLSIPGGPTAASNYPVIPAGGSETAVEPFALRVPADLRCGSTSDLQLRLQTSLGTFTLPVRLRVGREASQSTLLEDDVDTGRVKWKRKKGFSVATGVSTSGNSSYHAVDPGNDDGEDAQLSLLFMKKQVSIPDDAGQVRLSFFHVFNFEPGFDGGVLEISTDGGATWQDLGSRVIVGGYDGKVTAASRNPLGNRFAWTSRGKPGVFSQVVINLDDFAGQRVKLQFRAGFDEATGVAQGFAGWFIDDIRITTKRFVCR
jgi:hypothetical protein